MSKSLSNAVRFGLFTMLGMAATASTEAQSTPCSTNAATAAAHSARIVGILVHTDSTLLATQGLPFNPPGGAVLVTDPVICQAIVEAYNAPLAPVDTLRRIEKAYVFRVGPSTYAVAADKPSLRSSEVYVFFDENRNWLAGIAALE